MAQTTTTLTTPKCPQWSLIPSSTAPTKPSATTARAAVLVTTGWPEKNWIIQKNVKFHYLSCNGISAYGFDCPSGLKYDQEANQCGYAVDVPECGGSRPTTPRPVAPPAPQQQPGNNSPAEGGQSGSQQPGGSSGGQAGQQQPPAPATPVHPQQPGKLLIRKYA
jgi:hypothetical protein